MMLDLMEIWTRFDFLTYILLGCPALVGTFLLTLVNGFWKNHRPKRKTKDEQIDELRDDIATLQDEVELHRRVGERMAEIIALNKIGGNVK
jgi:hypothetical protein